MKKLLLIVPFLAVMLMQSLPAESHGYGWYARRGMAGGYNRGYGGGYGGGYNRGYGGGGYGGGYNQGYGGMNPYYNRGYSGYGGGYNQGYGGYGGMGGGLSRLFRGY